MNLTKLQCIKSKQIIYKFNLFYSGFYFYKIIYYHTHFDEYDRVSNTSWDYTKYIFTFNDKL